MNRKKSKRFFILSSICVLPYILAFIFLPASVLFYPFLMIFGVATVIFGLYSWRYGSGPIRFILALYFILIFAYWRLLVSISPF
jgi:hypothetical protein